MSIAAINPVNFSGEKKTSKGNTYNKTSAGTAIGIASGVALAGGLMHSQLRALKTIRGKRNLLSGYHERKITLNDIQDRVPVRDENGKIKPYAKGVSPRTKKVVGEFKKTLALWGAGIVAITTGLGKLADANINATKAKRADERAVKNS